MHDDDAGGRRRPRIVPERFAQRDPSPPHHDGPDPRSAARLDGRTALLLAMRRRRAAREALAERPASSARPRDVRAAAFADADIDDEYL